jgi:hypothetical protein
MHNTIQNLDKPFKHDTWPKKKETALATLSINSSLIHKYRFSVIKKNTHIQKKYLLGHRSRIDSLPQRSFLFCRLRALEDQHVTKSKFVPTLYIISIYHFLLIQKLFSQYSLTFPHLPKIPKKCQKKLSNELRRRRCGRWWKLGCELSWIRCGRIKIGYVSSG